MSDTVTLKATCTKCGGKFAMTDANDRVIEAYKVWDLEHKHPEETP
jgi:hypothetical protein